MMSKPLQIKKRDKESEVKVPAQELSDVDEEEEKRMAMAFSEVKQEGFYKQNRAVTMAAKKNGGVPKLPNASLRPDDN